MTDRKIVNLTSGKTKTKILTTFQYPRKLLNLEMLNISASYTVPFWFRKNLGPIVQSNNCLTKSFVENSTIFTKSTAVKCLPKLLRSFYIANAIHYHLL